MRYSVLLFLVWITVVCAPCPVCAGDGVPVQAVAENQWAGRKVAFLGDSITDEAHVGTTKNYWQYLQEMLGLVPFVYGVNGHQWSDLPGQCARLKAGCGDDIDAILIFAGTNDYNSGTPLGEWYTIESVPVRVSGLRTETRERRSPSMDGGTFRGRINAVMSYLKENFPAAQVILLTPVHRGYACFGDNNIQPDESFPNRLGLYVDAYVDVIKEAANVWAVPVIDLNSICGLYPNAGAHTRYFHDGETDRLHPNAEGHYRMAKALAYRLLSYPANFK